MSAGRRTVDLPNLGEAWGTTPQVGRSKRARAKVEALNGPARNTTGGRPSHTAPEWRYRSSANSAAALRRLTKTHARPDGVCTHPLGCDGVSVAGFPYCAVHHQRTIELSNDIKEKRNRGNR